jgi:hypothetical protein
MFVQQHLTLIMATMLKAERTMRSRRWSTCRLCHTEIVPGQMIGRIYYPQSWVHTSCIVSENELRKNGRLWRRMRRLCRFSQACPGRV